MVLGRLAAEATAMAAVNNTRYLASISKFERNETVVVWVSFQQKMNMIVCLNEMLPSWYSHAKLWALFRCSTLAAEHKQLITVANHMDDHMICWYMSSKYTTIIRRSHWPSYVGADNSQGNQSDQIDTIISLDKSMENVFHFDKLVKESYWWLAINLFGRNTWSLVTLQHWNRNCRVLTWMEGCILKLRPQPLNFRKNITPQTPHNFRLTVYNCD